MASELRDDGRVRDLRLADVHAKSLACVHCGLCLSSCPTYVETGRETSSPRGRIYLMRGAAEGRIELGDLLREESFLCLGCRACETACPAGVEYGAMLEETRAVVTAAGLRRGPALWLERMLLRGVVPRPGRLRALVSLLGFAQRHGIDRVTVGLLGRLPGLERLREAHALMPEIPAKSARAPLPELVAARGEKRGRVALFSGCIMPEFFGETHRATLRVLSYNGFEVVVPRTQGCCGALQAHAGDLEFARELARENVAAFAGVDRVVVNSAGCGAALREAESWLGAAGADLASRVRDVCEFLDEVGIRPPSARPATRVCYDDPCHLVHAQQVRDAARRLLAKIPGVELVEHADAVACCGAAGIYNLTHGEMSNAVLARKLDALEVATPDVIATGNPGCLMQIRAGVRARALRARVAHPIELLAEACD